MKYSITWNQKLVRVDYAGDIENRDIESAHLALNSDERFYDCRYLILDIANCNLDRVSVPDLDLVVAIDLGASITNKALKVAMIASEQESILKASAYIDRLRNSSWSLKVFSSVDDATVWFDA